MKTLLVFLVALLMITSLSAQWIFLESLHNKRTGFGYAYDKNNGGMENITNIPYDQLNCKQCHSVTGFFANGTPIDPVLYTPICVDCHNFNNGVIVEESACLNCHQRQLRERELFPNADVHKNEGMTCTSCHTEAELHGDDGVNYSSLKEQGAVKVKCTDCHTQLSNNGSHNRHRNKVDCAACHAVSVYSCGGCHFETYLGTSQKRFNNEFYDYRILVKKDGLVKLGAIVTHSYNGKTNYLISSTHSHIIKRQAVSCSDCHRGMGQINLAIQEYNDTGFITVTEWDSISRQVKILNQVIPLVKDWRYAFKVDHSYYSGDSSVFPSDPEMWEYLKSETDNAHLYFAEPLDSSTLANLGVTRFPTDVEEENYLPSEFKIYQNFPNPFNSSTTINWQSPVSGFLTIKLYDVLGKEVDTIVEGYYASGSHSKQYEVKSNLTSGIYFYRLKINEFAAVKRMLLLK